MKIKQNLSCYLLTFRLLIFHKKKLKKAKKGKRFDFNGNIACNQ